MQAVDLQWKNCPTFTVLTVPWMFLVVSLCVGVSLLHSSPVLVLSMPAAWLCWQFTWGREKVLGVLLPVGILCRGKAERDGAEGEEGSPTASLLVDREQQAQLSEVGRNTVPHSVHSGQVRCITGG